ncbi:dihydroorotase [Methanothermobacter tenebrarum]|uniref:Dihydroorotase n=1 Tax=Methanothermobacter tenebrarum TaxID=680118 RepID=A0A328P9Z7_9EURY|nr:dihydroorotase [Methanothermobacter tenebrarum]MBC7101203.1 dihydroorotase [Methanobacteriales archaeon]MBC7117481.1 dihydroorotase [Methanobacteriaceae archaeon]NPV65146.1 dihydroorotase [Methanobacteriaceae archaeon]RAO79518.1 dihydroorotase [Methanothermobacter tenebrarum]
MLDLALENCSINQNIVNIGVKDGKIASISKSPLKADKKINIKGKIILPGLIDAHVHFREPGYEYKEDFRTGSMAAAHGGFTTILDMPNTKPETNTAKEFKKKIKIASKKSIVDFGLHASINKIKEIEKIIPLKPASFKIFTEKIENHKISLIFQTLKGSKIPVTFHCEDPEIIEYYTSQLKDETRPEIYSLARPSIAEELAIAKAITFSHHYNHPTHICHVSSKKALKLIRSVRAPVTCEITPHHLLLRSKDLKKWGTITKTNPPLRPEKEAINFKDLKMIDIIATDHAPHTLQEKENNIWDAPPGIPNLEVTLKLLLTLTRKKRLKLARIQKMLSEKPASIFGLKNKGRIKIGMDADFVVIDPKKTGKIKTDEFYSKAHYTPFEGREYIGEPIMTILRGELIMEYGEISKNKGAHIKSKYTKE